MNLKRGQKAKYIKFCKKHNILGFGGLYYEAPCISLDVFAPKKKSSFVTERAITGHNVGVHASVEGAKEVTGVWAGMGWCMFGREFVESLTKEFNELFPDLTEFTAGYDKVKYKANYITVFPTAEEAKAAGKGA